MTRSKTLFSELDLRKVLESQRAKMFEEIDDYPENKLLNTAPEDLADYLTEKYQVDPLRIHDEDLRADVRDQKVDVSQDRHRVILNRGTPSYVDGTATTVELPFSGDPELLKCAGSRRSMNPPRAVTDGNVLGFTIHQTSPDAEAARRDIDRWVRDVKKGASWLDELVEPFNGKLRKEALGRIEQRRQKLLRDREYGEALGIPLKRRADAPTTYVPENVRRKPPPRPPKASAETYRPEPSLPPTEYEHILDILQKTATMLERSPDAFRGMGEEQLRDQFLVPLNSHYEGQSTGETFNRSGKTDILVRVGDRSVFIAECKIWRGPKAFHEALDQLLGYTTWRDTKTAVLVFNRNKNLSNVLEAIPDVAAAYPRFKRFGEYHSETGFRFVLGSPGDPNREISVTTLVFDVPAPGSSDQG